MKGGITPGRLVALVTGIAAVVLVATSLSMRSKEPMVLRQSAPSQQKGVEGTIMSSPDFWKTVNLKEKSIPEDVTSKATSVSVSHARINIMGVDTFYRVAEPPEGVQPSGECVLLLHGAAFKSQTWDDLGTLQILAAMGHKAIAVDLPGYGETTTSFTGEREEYLKSVLNELNLKKPVIISPSMSGSFSIPFLLKYGDLMGGYIPVAPVGTGAVRPKTSGIKVPTLILYGSKDTSLGHRSRDDLQDITNSQIVEIEGANHPAYLDQPKLFHTLLYNFIDHIHARKSLE